MYTQDDMSVLGVFDETEERTVQDYCLEYNLNLEETEVVMDYLSKALSMDVELNTLISDDEFENAYEILIDTQYSFEGLEESKPVSKSCRRLREADTSKYTLKDLNRGLKACGLRPLESLKDFESDSEKVENILKKLQSSQKNRQLSINPKIVTIARLLQIAQGSNKVYYKTVVPVITRILYIKNESDCINVLAGNFCVNTKDNKIISTNLQCDDVSTRKTLYNLMTKETETLINDNKISTDCKDPKSVFFQKGKDYLLLVTKPNNMNLAKNVISPFLSNFKSEDAFRQLFANKKSTIDKLWSKVKKPKDIDVKCRNIQPTSAQNLANSIDVEGFNDNEIKIFLNNKDLDYIDIAIELMNDYRINKDNSKLKGFFSEKEPEQVENNDSEETKADSKGTPTKNREVNNSDRSDSEESTSKKGNKSVDVSFRDKNIGKFNINQPLVKAVIDLEGLQKHTRQRGALRNQQRKDALRDLLLDWQLISEKVERSGLYNEKN